MSPLQNPQATDSVGHYQWDVIEGSWRVTVSALGYVTQTSRIVVIPPPVTDLNVELQPVGTSGGSGPPPARGPYKAFLPLLAIQ